MPCARCSSWVDHPRWLASADTSPARLARLQHCRWDVHGNALYCVCRPSCLVTRWRRELANLEGLLPGLTLEQIQVYLHLLNLLAVQVQEEHQRELIDDERGIPFWLPPLGLRAALPPIPQDPQGECAHSLVHGPRPTECARSEA